MATQSVTRPTNPAESVKRPPTDHEPMTVENASRRLGISPNAVLQRVKRGTLYQERRDGTRFVWVPMVGTVGPTGGTTTTTRRPSANADLARLLETLVRDNGDLRATAAIWQERHDVLMERLTAVEHRAMLAEQHLEALGHTLTISEATGDVLAMAAPATVHDATESATVTTSSTPTPPNGVWTRLRNRLAR